MAGRIAVRHAATLEDTMIPEVDEALRALIVAGAAVDVSFEMPGGGRPDPGQAKPVINAYLYDIREDVDRRQFGFTPVAGEGDTVVRRHQPHWFRLSYLVTAWADRAAAEHRLLAGLLTDFLSHEELTPSELPGALGALGLPVPLSVSGTPAASRSLAEIWSALGSELRPSLDVTVTAPFPARSDHTAGPRITEAPAVHMRRSDRVGPPGGGRPGPRGTGTGHAAK
ncbi:DUF4255 domain-containing protein [Streptomyces sp. NPDC048409]|uniref:DUF4255 domain-containing protein n=1 Tax=Streptomyces sp. NPDC048409 TaxID=3154723 RepID=UPI003436F82A